MDRALRVYDLRTNQHLTLKQNPLRRTHLDDFIACCQAGMPRTARKESERFRPFGLRRDSRPRQADLDITWLRDHLLEDLDNLPSPDVIAREIIEDLTAALAEFEVVATTLETQLDQSRR
ncbi:MAG: hypothetical protein ACRCSN_17860 [Dermatophilaceae bacterium]